MASRHAVVIPVYRTTLSAAERFSVQTTVSVMAAHDIYLAGPASRRGQFDHLVDARGAPLPYVAFADDYFTSIAGYNRLLLSRRFYEAFSRYGHILVSQTDALTLRDELDDWSARGYSYVGAPWYVGYTTPVLPLRFLGVGNGGFSLRCVADFLRVLSHPRVFRNPLMAHWPGSWKSNAYRFLRDYHALVTPNRQFNLKVNEDVFWGMFVPRQCSFFRVAPIDEAVAFAFEAYPDFLFERNGRQLPFGCHAWERYDRDFWLKAFAGLHLDVGSLRGTADPETPIMSASLHRVKSRIP